MARGWTPLSEAKKDARKGVRDTLRTLFTKGEAYPDIMGESPTSPKPKQPTEELIGKPYPMATPPDQPPYDIASEYQEAIKRLSPVTVPYERGMAPPAIQIEQVAERPEGDGEILENKEERITQGVLSTAQDIAKKNIVEVQSGETDKPKSLGSVWEEALVTFAPIALGILEPGLKTGKIGLDAQKHYLARRDLAEKKELEKSKALTGGLAGYVTKPYFDEKTKTTRWGKVDRKTGEMIRSPNDPIVGVAPRLAEDVTGAKVVVNPSDPNMVIKNKMGGYAKYEHKIIDAVRKDLKTGPLGKQYEDSLKRYSQAANAKELLVAGKLVGSKDGKPAYEYNQIAGEVAKTSILRMAGEVGTLSDNDHRRLGTTKSISNIAQGIFLRVTEGQPLTIRDRENLIEIVDIFERNSAYKTQNFLEQNIDSYARQYKGSSITRADLLEVLNPYGAKYTGRANLPHEQMNIRGYAPTKSDMEKSRKADSSVEARPMPSSGNVKVIDTKENKIYTLTPEDAMEALKEPGVEIYRE